MNRLMPNEPVGVNCYSVTLYVAIVPILTMVSFIRKQPIPVSIVTALIFALYHHHVFVLVDTLQLQRVMTLTLRGATTTTTTTMTTTTNTKSSSTVTFRRKVQDDEHDGDFGSNCTTNNNYDNNNSKNNEDCRFSRQRQANPNHIDDQDESNECYVFDYDAAATNYGQDLENVNVEFWDQFESQNKARQKFGLAALTREEYVVLQAETQAMGEELSQEAVLLAFRQFDTNKDGVISWQELQTGIRDILRTELTDEHVESVMKHLDSSGDGMLQVEEMVTLNELRKRLQAVVQEEQRQLKLEESTKPQQQQQQQQQRQRQKEQPGLLKSFLAAFRLTDEHACESNFDCVRPEVCCDFLFKKFCCSSGKMAHDLQLQYATVPVPQQS
jgi:hypothetical protein